MPTFTSYKGSSDGIPKEAKITKPDTLEEDYVLVEVTASGLCGTDLHYKTADMVLGHEGVGRVMSTGPKVRHLKVGDRVGWGYATDSCGHCSQCLRGDDVFCPERAMYGYASLDQGSFSSHAIWREAFLHVIPNELSDELAAPLQCAGATVFSAIYGVQPNETVGILGIGGLGHLALQFAAKLGCRVIALSGSSRKKDEALKLGAHQFIAMGEGKVSADDLLAPIDRLLITTSAQPDWDALFPLMAPKSVIYPLTVDSGKLEIPYMPLLISGIGIQGSVVASRWMHRKMLEFAAQHSIHAKVETFPMNETGVREAMKKLESGDLHFRAVLKPVGKE